MDYLPFYLQSKNDNIITEDKINSFYENNTELEPLREKFSPVLRLLDLSEFESLTYWIISQQISGYVAEQLIQRLQQLASPLTTSQFSSLSEEALSNIGLSKFKISYIGSLVEFIQTQGELDKKDDYSSEYVRSYYTQVRGIGEWTVNMHLIFVWGRMDIGAPKDLVVRKGLKQMYTLDSIPTEKEARLICEKWGELATIGTILAWAVMGE